MNLSKSCVPFGIAPNPSARVMVISFDQPVALGVDRISRPFGREPLRQRVQRKLRVGRMLDHLHGGDQVESAFDILDRSHPIVDLQPLPRRMVARGRNQLLRRIDRGDFRAQPGQRLREQARRRNRRRARSSPRADGGCARRATNAGRSSRGCRPSRTGLSLCSIAEAPSRVPPVAGELPELLDFSRLRRLSRPCAAS